MRSGGSYRGRSRSLSCKLGLRGLLSKPVGIVIAQGKTPVEQACKTAGNTICKIVEKIRSDVINSWDFSRFQFGQDAIDIGRSS